LRLPTFGQAAAALSIIGLACLTYLAGAATMYFQLPSSDFLGKAFSGANAWGAQPVPELPSADLTKALVSVDRVGAACDGFTLCTTTQGPEAMLLDMRGKVVHQWKLPFDPVWPRAADVRAPLPGEELHWDRCHLSPNGDVLALYGGGGGSPYGLGLAKCDKDSHLLWSYSANVHHDLDVDEDGNVYVLTSRTGATPPPGVESVPAGYTADDLLVLSPDGKQLATIPILEAFRDSSFALTLFSGLVPDLRRGVIVLSPSQPPPGLPGATGGGFHMTAAVMPPGTPPPPGIPGPVEPLDILHANSVRVLTRALAAKFPQFRPGQVLVSLRSPSILAVLDPPTRSVVWAARGPWQLQHDAEFLDNGHLLVFDNLGALTGTRLLEFDPATQAVPWSYAPPPADSFTAITRGASQRLANGNTLFVDPTGRRLVEVTAGKEVVWEWRWPAPAPDPKLPQDALAITTGRRFDPEDLPFLKEGGRDGPR
jgi:hypothetical protein